MTTQCLPGNTGLSVFECEAGAPHAAAIASSTAFVAWVDLWTATVYARLYERGASFAMLPPPPPPVTAASPVPLTDIINITQQQQSGGGKLVVVKQPQATADAVAVLREADLDSLLSAASKHAAAVFTRARHHAVAVASNPGGAFDAGLTAAARKLDQLEAQLSATRAASMARAVHVRDSVVAFQRAHGEFAAALHSACVASHDQIFRLQGVQVVHNAGAQLDAARRILVSVRGAVDEIRESREAAATGRLAAERKATEELLRSIAVPDSS